MLAYSQKNELLSIKIDSMVQLDQENQRKLLDLISQNKIELSKKFNDSIKMMYQKNCKECERIFQKYGYPNYDVVGVKSSYNFWLLVQHCDSEVKFQKNILKALKVQVKKGKADPKNLAYLTDRVRKNQKKKQIYGTQVYRDKEGIYKPHPIKKEKRVNERRRELGLDSIEDYLNFMNYN